VPGSARKTYVVFNAQQCDGLEAFEAPELVDHERLDVAEQLVAGYRLRPATVYGSTEESYSAARDLVRMPELGAFESADAFYCTLFHELVNSTGHESRLGRLEPAHLGTDPYAREELIAEMGAAMLLGAAGLVPRIP
jgi:antirestriction protein ArdC